jgi:hypothetical protein
MAKRLWIPLALVMSASALFFLFAATRSGNVFDARSEIQTAWQTARSTGGYSFRADLIERAIPLAQTSNVGRTSKEYTYHLEGVTSGLNAFDASARKFEMSFWDNGGAVADPKTAAQFQLTNGKAMARRGDTDWEQVDDISSGFAPDGDFMAFLAGAKNIVNAGSETRWGGTEPGSVPPPISFTRYTFDIDGTGFAMFVRDQLQARMRERGELPYAMNLEMPAQYEHMTGSGELWVRENGLPLRQKIIAHFPPPSAQDDSRTDYEFTVDFFDYAVVEKQKPFYTMTGFVDFGNSLRAIGGEIAAMNSIASQSTLLAMAKTSATYIFAFALFGLLILFFAKHYRDRRVYAALALFVIFAMEANPLMQTAQASTFVNTQRAKTNEQQEKTDKQKAERELYEKFQEYNEWKPQSDPRGVVSNLQSPISNLQ